MHARRPAYERWSERQFDDAWAVFAPEIIGADRFGATLRVERVWKGEVGRIVSMGDRHLQRRRRHALDGQL